MPRNTLGDMHNLLMEQMERLAEADFEELDQEVNRAKAMSSMATAVNNNASTIITAMSMHADLQLKVPKILSPGDSQ